MDYSPVAFSPNGQWLVVGIREVGGSPARQMWVMQPDGSLRQQITQELAGQYQRIPMEPCR